MEHDLLDPPVYLYIKTHRATGLKYFGRTVKDPFRYKGSGLYWLRHLEAHGNEVDTKIFGVYTSRSQLVAAADAFSRKHNIADSPEWANLISETGLAQLEGWVASSDYRKQASERMKELWADTDHRGRRVENQRAAWDDERHRKHLEALQARWTPEARAERSEWAREHYAAVRDKLIEASRAPMTEEAKAKLSATLKGRSKSDTHRAKLSAAAKNRKHSRAPKEAVFVEPGCYNVYGVNLFSSKRNVWQTEDGSRRFRSLKEAVQILSES